MYEMDSFYSLQAIESSALGILHSDSVFVSYKGKLLVAGQPTVLQLATARLQYCTICKDLCLR